MTAVLSDDFMGELLLENSWWVLAIGGSLSMGFLVWWIRSGDREPRILGLGVAGVACLVAGIGFWIETEAESLRLMMRETADALEHNRWQEVDAAVYDRPSTAVIRARELLESGRIRFEVARIKKIHSLEISGPPEARRAAVKLNVYVETIWREHRFRVPRYVELVLFRVDGRWKVYDFRHDQPLKGFQIDELDQPHPE